MKPLTALEWLRVTHADTLSGRRIEEAVAAARAEERQRWITALEALAAELEADGLRWSVLDLADAAARVRAVVAIESLP